MFAEIATLDANAFRNNNFPVPDDAVPTPKYVAVSDPDVHLGKTVFAAFDAVLLAIVILLQEDITQLP
jgi:hypothetical protein